MGASFRSPAQVARRLRLLPLALKHLKNWGSFIFHYALGLTPQSAYRFRNGASVQIARALDHVPLIEVFLRQDYGKIADKAVVLDLGANIGAFSIYAATTARSVQVYAYEPFPAFFELLQRNIRQNRLEETVRCFNLAVASDASNRDLQTQGADLFFPRLRRETNAAAAPPQFRTVLCTTLSDILRVNALATVDLLKMDCEGSEYEILYSTPASIFSRIKELRIEYHNLSAPEENVQNLKRFLNASGYTVIHEKPISETNGNLWAQRRS